MATTRPRIRPVTPDAIDLRDRPYRPSVTDAPPATLDARKFFTFPVLDQRDTNACTGFALSNVVNYLLVKADRAREAPVSPFMLYSMARRYDEFPGATADTGSSLRGAMKGWYRHGACASELWTGLDMPQAAAAAVDDWWQDAARRPLGAYYRVDHRSVSDMHVALAEAGVLYASAVCHAGWDEGAGVRHDAIWPVPFQKAQPDDGGHAFVIVGYGERGFIVLNSWDTSWGTQGYAILTYDDWLAHAMDCWVAQLGVVTEQHREVATALSLRTTDHTVRLATEPMLRERELSPFIIDMENNGQLSRSGAFRTGVDDIRALLTTHLAAARRAWGRSAADVVDVAIYAHGGLTSERTAAETAAQWIPALYEKEIFPIFLMWETDLFSTLKFRLQDLVSAEPRVTGGVRDQLQRWWNERLERTLAAPGSAIWGEMKQNAAAMSADGASRGAVRVLYETNQGLGALTPANTRLHLIGHSAGAIAHSLIVDQLTGFEKSAWGFSSVTFMAPAVRVDTFKATVLEALETGRVKRYHHFQLTDEMEQKDPTCRAVVLYGRSLLYLVSESFEHGVRTPILGMARYSADALGGLPAGKVRVFDAPSAASHATTHGAFDNDPTTIATVIDLIKTAP